MLDPARILFIELSSYDGIRINTEFRNLCSYGNLHFLREPIDAIQRHKFNELICICCSFVMEQKINDQA